MPSMAPFFQKESLHVTEEHLGLRLDKLLGRAFPEYSRTYFQKLIADGSVLINHRQPKKRETLHLHDEVEISFSPSYETALEPENIPLNILYEDNLNPWECLDQIEELLGQEARTLIERS